MTFQDALQQSVQTNCGFRPLGDESICLFVRPAGAKQELAVFMTARKRREQRRQTEIGCPVMVRLLLGAWELCEHPEGPRKKGPGLMELLGN